MQLKKISEFEYELPKTGNMLVPGRIYASDKLINLIKNDKTLEQLENMAHLPGIQKYAVAMPDAHQGYGFCIGGVAALSTKEGGISPGGVGFDINCGVRVMKTSLTYDEVRPKIGELINNLFNNVPSGLGSKGNFRLNREELKKVLEQGVEYLVSFGIANENDLKNCEENGRMKQANSNNISDKAFGRGLNQLGSLGSGNHFIDVHVVDEIFDEKIAKEWGIFKNQVLVTIHCGSRGLGHQVATDYVNLIQKKHPEIMSKLKDKELAYAPARSQTAIDYFSAMSCAANYAWANRQVIMHNVRKVFTKLFGDKDYDLFYDVCHNICKIETHNGVECYVHRKGATRSFPGEKVILPGSMGTASYLLIGGSESMNKSFGSTAHGAGRIMSRTKAKKTLTPEKVLNEMKSKNILLKSSTHWGMAEESEHAYKDVDEVVRVSDSLGIAKKVVKLRPIGVING